MGHKKILTTLKDFSFLFDTKILSIQKHAGNITQTNYPQSV